MCPRINVAKKETKHGREKMQTENNGNGDLSREEKKDAGAPSTVGQTMGVANPPKSGRRAGRVGEQRQDDADEG